MSTAQCQVIDVVSIIRRHPELLQACVSKVREHRLEALQTDPEAFTSTYEHESKQAVGFWEARIQNPDARQLVVMRTEPGKPATDIFRSPWLGSLVVRGPRSVDDDFDNLHTWKSFGDGSPKPDGEKGSSEAMYLINAVYVSPACRRQGVGGCLLREALGMIQKETSSVKRSICIITVAQHNLAAQRIYATAGFEMVAQEVARRRDGEKLVELVLRRDLTRD